MNTARRLSPRWLLVTAVVFLADLFLHLPITDFCEWLAREYGFTAYDNAVRLGFIAMGLAAYAAIWRWSGRHRRTFGLAATALLVLVVIAHKVIVVNAVESIHYPQYALLVLLLARAGTGLEAAWVGATVLGAIDEGYQAAVLPRGAPDYFDWNDVVLNGIGAAFGALMVLAFTGFAGPGPDWRSLGTRVTILTAAIVVAVALGPPIWSPFLEATPGGRGFHRLAASEGIVILSVVYGFVVWLRARCRPAL